MTELEDFLVDKYKSLLNLSKEQGKLSSNVYVSLSLKDISSLDDLEQAYSELTHFLQHHEYYDTISRIEKGESLLNKETDSTQIQRYKARLNVLYAKLERLEEAS